MKKKLKLNLGCGNNPIEGFINVDHCDGKGIDKVLDLEQTPWPWEDNSVEAIVASHIMEHLGHDPAVYLGTWKEIYRVLEPGGSILVITPHHRSDDLLNDPTHIRAVTVPSLMLFDALRCKEWQKARAANTPLALQLGIDFRVGSADYEMTADFRNKYIGMDDTVMDANGKTDLVRTAMSEAVYLNNIFSQVTILLTAVKGDGDENS